MNDTTPVTNRGGAGTTIRNAEIIQGMTMPPTLLRDRLRWSDPLTLAIWLAILVVNTTLNGFVSRSDHPHAESWEPWTWEITSSLVVALLIPLILWFYRRVPLTFGNWRRALPLHLLASIVFCVVHVAGMVMLRVLVYRQMHGQYDFGDWRDSLVYEYLKDVRSYFFILMVAWGSRFLLLRSGGEASMLAPPDVGVPQVDEAQPARPERFLVRKLDREFLIATRDIERIEANGNYVNLIVGDRVYPMRGTMAGIEAQLDPSEFIRIHRSHIVGAHRIASIEPLDTGDARVHLKDGGQLPCSRGYRANLRQRLGQET